ncbi:hypothetical protein COO91_05927 [Nostoc flagelliforme CCNUN1]|uniref:Uncharacterized protein n=1 Tax=Nostoc flagelliforme CCNUN1 TaxID=2038116 RepID=A0A2K8SX32_9NOSO|nr:hypothetical protein COO91_05927 [Nostoc flagelliforme CCNUN1]
MQLFLHWQLFFRQNLRSIASCVSPEYFCDRQVDLHCRGTALLIRVNLT